MEKIAITLLVYLFVSASNADIITIEHNINNLPSSGRVSIDLDADGLDDVYLASNFYIATKGNAQFTSSYSLLGDVIDVNTPWRGGNTWPNASGYVQDDHLYLPIRNTTIGNYYGYITYDYHVDSNSVSLNSYTYENSGAAITVVPEPSSGILLASTICSIGWIRRRFRK